METLGKVVAFIIFIPIAWFGIQALIAAIMGFFVSNVSKDGVERTIGCGIGVIGLIIAFCVYALLKFIW